MGAETAERAATAAYGERPQRRALAGAVGVAAVATLAMSGVFAAAEWHAANVSLPRYCAGPDAALARIRAIVSEDRPAGDGATRPYIIAAKLLYLKPRLAGETVDAYVARLGLYMEEHCR